MSLKDKLGSIFPKTIFGQSLSALMLNTLVVVVLFAFLFVTVEQKQYANKINDQMKSDASIIASKIETALYTNNKAVITDITADFQLKDYIANIYVYDKDGLLWYHSRHANNNSGRMPNITTDELKSIMTGVSGTSSIKKNDANYIVSKVSINRIDNILDFREDKQNNKGSLGVVLLEKDYTVLKTHFIEIIQLLSFIAILTIGVSVLIAVFFAKYISRPILDLKEITNNISPENLETASIDIKGGMEIQELKNAFVKLLSSINYFHKILSNEKKQLLTILDGINDYILIVDRNNNVLYQNPAIQRICRICNDSMSSTGCPLLETLLAKFSEFETINRENRKNVLRFTFEEGCHEKSLDIASSEILFDEKPAILAVMRDMTEKKRLEEELAKINKLQAIGVLAGGIAHDFNNILTAILGNVQIAMMKLTPGHPASKRLERAENAISRAASITKQLLTFAKGGSPVAGSMDIKNVIKETAEFALRGAKIVCQYNFPDGLWHVKADSGQMSQVFHNLLINANQAMPDGGSITIEAKNHEIAVSDEALPLEPGKYVIITVTDTGTGIAPEIMTRIFDPFFTTKEMGNGLGLATCFSIMKKHKGYITVSSSPGIGSTFSLYLPVSPDTVQEELSPPQKTNISIPESKLCGMQQRILVMDDEPMLRELFVDTLEEARCRVDACMDGDEAIGLYLKEYNSGNPYHLVILDLTIPGGKGGKETAVEILKINPNAKIIVCSGYADSEILSSFHKYGFCANLPKPFSGAELRSIVEKVLI